MPADLDQRGEEGMQSVPWDHNPIGQGGCYSGVGLDEYHGDLCTGPSVSSSGLRLLYHKSAAHFFHRSYLNPDRAVDDETKIDREWKVLGNAAHFLLCGGVGTFREAFAIRPDVAPDGTGRAWNGNNKACKRWIATAHRNNKIVVTLAQLEAIKSMSLSLAKHPIAGGGVLDGLIERSLVWRDPETGIWLKARPDVLLPSSVEICDLKTTRSVLLPDLMRSTTELGYHMQGALAVDGVKTVFGLDAANFILCWLEKSAPHCVRVTTIDQDDIERGRKMNRVALRRFADCLDQDYWPGPGEDEDMAAELHLSLAARERIDARLRTEGMLK
jgi:hypothetical protein